MNILLGVLLVLSAFLWMLTYNQLGTTKVYSENTLKLLADERRQLAERDEELNRLRETHTKREAELCDQVRQYEGAVATLQGDLALEVAYNDNLDDFVVALTEDCDNGDDTIAILLAELMERK